MKKFFLFLCFLTFLSPSLFRAQTGDVKIGADPSNYRNAQGAFYDYSDPEAVNIKVSVWGFVKFPGRYLVPSYINVRDLLSYAGGPTDEAHMDDLRLYRILPDSTQTMLKFNYNDLLWEKDLKSKKLDIPNLTVGDILLVPGEPRLYFRDYFTMTLSVISTLISLAILIINIVQN
ncbi:MAG: SLBB domain-containing protein [Bacteroidota bacterium]